MLMYIDPSYTGTGIYWKSENVDDFGFELIEQGRSKVTLKNYLEAGFTLRDEFKQIVSRLYAIYTEQIGVVIEAPFPGGASSCGLYGLQFLLQDYMLNGSQVFKSVKSLAPSFIHSFVTQQIKSGVVAGKDSTSVRKQLASKYFVHPTGIVRNEELLLKHAGGDVATAFLFAKGLEMKKATLIDLL